MKWTVLAAAVGLSVGVGCLVAADQKADSKAPATTQAATPVNKKCPVSGDDVDPKAKTVTYKGKIVGFCCDECIDKFNKDPDKYAKDMK